MPLIPDDVSVSARITTETSLAMCVRVCVFVTGFPIWLIQCDFRPPTNRESLLAITPTSCCFLEA